MSSSGLPSSDRSASGLPALLRIIIAPSVVASDRLGSEPACKLALTPYFEPQSGYAVSIWRVILCRPMLIFSVLSAQLDPTQLDMLFHVVWHPSTPPRIDMAFMQSCSFLGKKKALKAQAATHTFGMVHILSALLQPSGTSSSYGSACFDPSSEYPPPSRYHHIWSVWHPCNFGWRCSFINQPF